MSGRGIVAHPMQQHVAVDLPKLWWTVSRRGSDAAQVSRGNKATADLRGAILSDLQLYAEKQCTRCKATSKHDVRWVLGLSSRILCPCVWHSVESIDYDQMIR